MSATVA